MSFSIGIDRVLKKLEQRVICTSVAVEAIMQLIDMHRIGPQDAGEAARLRSHVTRQVLLYRVQDIDRAQLASALEAVRTMSRMMA